MLESRIVARTLLAKADIVLACLGELRDHAVSRSYVESLLKDGGRLLCPGACDTFDSPASGGRGAVRRFVQPDKECARVAVGAFDGCEYECQYCYYYRWTCPLS